MKVLEVIKERLLFPPRQTWLKEYTENGSPPETLKDLYRKMRIVESPRPEIIKPLLDWLRYSLELISDKLIPDKEITEILNLATGHGGLEGLIAEWAVKKGLRVKLTGIDISQIAIDVASEVVNGRENIHFQLGDARSLDFKNKSFDLVISNNLVHHLSERDLLLVTKEAIRVARYGIFFLDPLRCSWGIKVVGLLSRKYPEVQHEATTSFKKSYLPQELRSLIEGVSEDVGVEINVEARFPWFLCIKGNFEPID